MDCQLSSELLNMTEYNFNKAHSQSLTLLFSHIILIILPEPSQRVACGA